MDNRYESFVKKAVQRGKIKRIIALLSVFVLLITTQSLKWDADTMEAPVFCGLKAHTHTEECFDETGALICSQPEHVHTAECFVEVPEHLESRETMASSGEEAFELFEEPVPLAGAIVLGEEMPDISVEAVEPNIDAANASAPMDYVVGGRDSFTLSDVIRDSCAQLELDDVLEIGQVIEQDGEELSIGWERLENGDYEIMPIRSFDCVELAIITDDDIYVIKLIDADVIAESQSSSSALEPEATAEPTVTPTPAPTAEPTPTATPAEAPVAVEPTIIPDDEVAVGETVAPTVAPTDEVEAEETAEPTVAPDEDFNTEEIEESEEETQESKGEVEESEEEAQESEEGVEESEEETEEPSEDTMDSPESEAKIESVIDLTELELPCALDALLAKAYEACAPTAFAPDEIEYDAALLAIEQIDGVWFIVSAEPFMETTIAIGEDYILTLANWAEKASLDLGIAQVSAVDGLLPPDSEGHAFIVNGDAKALAAEEIRAFLNARAAGGSRRAKSKSQNAASRTEYEVFEIGVDNVDEAEYQFHVRVTLPEALRGRDFRLYHIHEGDVTEVADFAPSFISASEGAQALIGFEFTTENFSEFVLSYTVDFEYSVNGETYELSLAGGDSITLSDLVETLNIIDGTGFTSASEFIAQVEDVRFSDESLVKVTQIEGDWVLESLLPFTSEETLTIIMKNGDVVTVQVTDAQIIDPIDTANAVDLHDYVSSAVLVVDGEALESPWTVVDGTKYNLRLEFKEDAAHQFPDNATAMIYQIPDGIDLGTTPFEQIFTIGDLQGNRWQYDPENKQIIIQFNTDDVQNFTGLTTDDKAHFYLDIEVDIDSQREKIEFNDNVKVEVIDGTNHDFTVSKVGKYNPETGKTDYTLKVKSSGTNKDVTVTDTLKGTALHLIQPVNVTGNASGTVSTTYNIAADGSNEHDSFTTTISEMKDGEEITITYSASVDFDELDGRHGTVQQTQNDVDVDSGIVHKDETTDVHNTIDFSPVEKSAGAVTNDGNKRKIPWTITVNDPPKVSMGGKTVTDEIGASSQSFMKYSGEGIRVDVYDDAGTLVETRNPEWKDLEQHSDSSWTYKIPETDTEPYKYVITYTTEADMTGRISDATVTNHAGTDYDEDDGTQHVDPGEDKVTIKKETTEVTSQYITWEASFTVPENGLDEAVFTDAYPTAVIYSDTLNEITVDETNLLPTERYTIDTSESSYATITFEKYVDGQWVPGLQATDSERTIKINIKTNNNQDWVTAGAGNALLRPHTNNISLKVEDETITASAYGSPTTQTFSKKGEQVGTVVKDGVELPVFRYTLLLTGVDRDSFDITDTFDSHLEFYNTNGQRVARDNPSVAVPFIGSVPLSFFPQRLTGGENVDAVIVSYYAPLAGQNGPVLTPETTSDHSMTFHVTNVPKSGSDYYAVYEFVYYMVVKDKAALKDVAQTSLSNNCYYEFDNTAEWLGLDDDATVNYLAYPMSKKAAGNASQANDFTDTFTIVLNPEAITLNNGEDIKVEDTLTNLNVDFSTVNIVLEPARDDYVVDWTFSDNVGIFWIPDNTKVTITYDAQVVGDTNGQKVSYSNTARMLGYHATDGHTVTITGRGGGGYNANYHVRLYKYENNTMNVPLAGATFQLYDANKHPITYEKDSDSYDTDAPISHTNHKAGDPVTFTTGSDGYVDIKLYGTDQDGNSAEFALGWMTDYYLYETVVPDGYEKEDIYWHFKIGATDSFNNTTHTYQYHNGGIVKVSNTTKDNALVIRKTFEGEELPDEEKSNISFIVKGVSDGVTVFDRTISYSEFSGGQYRFKSLPEGTYTITETNQNVSGYTATTIVRVDEGTAVSGRKAEVDIGGDDHTVSFSNTYAKLTSLVIHKVDADTGELISGAKFSVESYYSRVFGIITGWDKLSGSPLTVSGDGTLELAGLDDNTLYRIRETQAPDGYVLPEPNDYIYFYKYAATQPTSITKPGDLDIGNIHFYKNGLVYEVENTKQTGSVKVTKVFSGVDALPDTFRISAKYGDPEQTIVLTTSETQRENVTLAGTGAEDDPYTWIISDLPIGTEVTFTESGYERAGYDVEVTVNRTAVAEADVKQAAATAATKPGEAHFVNIYTEKTSFSFNKIWLDSDGNVSDPDTYKEWQQGITVTIKRKASKTDENFALVYTITGPGGNVSPEAGSKRPEEEGAVDALTLTASASSHVFSFTLPTDSLKACADDGTQWTYFVEEVGLANYVTHYGTVSEEGVGSKTFATDAKDGGLIINQTFGGYELPSTGGPGTRRFTILGSILILGACVLLWRRRRSA